MVETVPENNTFAQVNLKEVQAELLKQVED